MDQAAAQQYLAELDLTYLVDKLSSDDYELTPWKREDAQTCVELYKRFLWLSRQYSKDKLVPTQDMDEVWHQHILNTQRYHQDCNAIFGHYFHHLPSNPNDPEDAQTLQQQFQKTQALYLKEYGEELVIFEEK